MRTAIVAVVALLLVIGPLMAQDMSVTYSYSMLDQDPGPNMLFMSALNGTNYTVTIPSAPFSSDSTFMLFLFHTNNATKAAGLLRSVAVLYIQPLPFEKAKIGNYLLGNRVIAKMLDGLVDDVSSQPKVIGDVTIFKIPLRLPRPTPPVYALRQPMSVQSIVRLVFVKYEPE
jgi:hypothetical protein